jgi:hypothetical protein
MPLDNFSLLSSIWGATAVITHVEFQETRSNDKSSRRALIVARDGQMLFPTLLARHDLGQLWAGHIKR